MQAKNDPIKEANEREKKRLQMAEYRAKQKAQKEAEQREAVSKNRNK